MTPENRKALSDFRLKLDSLLADFDESARRVVTAQANAPQLEARQGPQGRQRPHFGLQQ